MKCSNCGANYEDGRAECPFCGTENVPVVEAEQREYVKKLKKAAGDQKYVPYQAGQKAEKKTGRVLKWVLLLILAAMLVTAVFSVIRSRTSYSRLQSRKAELEAMYQAGEIKELDAYMQKHDLMGKDTFVKYAEMADLYECLDSAEINTKEHVEQIRRDSGSMSTKELRDVYTEVVEGDIFRCFRVLSITEGWEADGYIYDQQEVAEDFHSRAEEILRDIYQLTEEEIADGTKAYTYDKYYTEIAGEAIERLAG